jgi:hypothetical protein
MESFATPVALGYRAEKAVKRVLGRVVHRSRLIEALLGRADDLLLGKECRYRVQLAVQLSLYGRRKAVALLLKRAAQ